METLMNNVLLGGITVNEENIMIMGNKS